MYLPVPGIEPTSSVFLDKCVTSEATVADEVLFCKYMISSPEIGEKVSKILLRKVFFCKYGFTLLKILQSQYTSGLHV